MNEYFFNGVEWTAKVRCFGRPMSVVMSFASGEEMETISSWADYADYPTEYLSEYLSTSASDWTRDQKDILEYASLLGGMYRVYDSNERFAANANRLERVIRENPREDVLFVLVMKLPASGDVPAPFTNGEILGFAAMRHTWKNTVKLEFLASSPFHKGMEADMRLRGVGSALLMASVHSSEILSAPMFWGESTDTSLGFYLDRKFKTLEEIVFLDTAGITRFVDDTIRRFRHDIY